MSKQILIQFTDWKSNVEKSTVCSYIQHDTAKKYNKATHFYYYCNRSGNYSPPRKNQPRVRATKKQGMCGTSTDVTIVCILEKNQKGH